MALGSAHMAIGAGIDAFLQFFVSFIDFISSLIAGVVLGIEQIHSGIVSAQASTEHRGGKGEWFGQG